MDLNVQMKIEGGRIRDDIAGELEMTTEWDNSKAGPALGQRE
jgi:hypothetical protein